MKKLSGNFCSAYEAKVIPLSKEVALAGFQASISGKDEDFKRSSDLQIQLNKATADPRGIRPAESVSSRDGRIREPLLKRQLDIIYNSYLENQIPIAQNGSDGQAAGADRAEVQYLPHPAWTARS